MQQLLQCHRMLNCNFISTLLDFSLKLIATTENDTLADAHEYASIMEGLMFVIYVTCSDIIYAVEQLSQLLNNLSTIHMLTTKLVLQYFKSTFMLGILYKLLSMQLTSYSDADWASDISTKRSTTRYIVILNNSYFLTQSTTTYCCTIYNGSRIHGLYSSYERAEMTITI